MLFFTPQAKRDPCALSWQAVLLIYVFSGFYGALWISDEWDGLRLAAIGYVGIPATLIYCLCHYFFKGWHWGFPKTHLVLVLTLVISFGFGHVSAINAFFSDSKAVSVFVSGQTAATSMEWQHYRGALGLLYRRRW